MENELITKILKIQEHRNDYYFFRFEIKIKMDNKKQKIVYVLEDGYIGRVTRFPTVHLMHEWCMSIKDLDFDEEEKYYEQNYIEC